MAQSGQLKKLAGPAYIAASATNVYTPEAATIYTILKHLHFCNVTASAVTFSMYIGATGGSAAGTEIFKDLSIAAKSTYDWYGNVKMLSTDFLTAISTASSITVVVMGELVVV